MYVLAADGRRSLLTINLKEVSLDPGCDLAEVAKLTEGYSGADITNLCRYIIRVLDLGCFIALPWALGISNVSRVGSGFLTLTDDPFCERLSRFKI